ncbi:TetR/AcrR family transcriptional regulator [Rhizobium alvei]|uniref:TetR/AcrR family transcriptional regulator n=1 Tax=Rhizobium alvei TaxID=1132659 RepID=A0ABT8YIF8_9HYPH|nr:TetR/AcrR family transcriptional regulator [Rhizobium alvei]MDO6963217.1 TetR/AcrR family transcriptional regulator [Rhizobium alvei]
MQQEQTVRRRHSPKGSLRRSQILEAAMRVFSRDGYHNAAIAAIAEEVGLTLAGLLHHFPSKVDLLLAILEQRDIEGHALIRKSEADWRALLAGLKMLNRHNAANPDLVRLFSILNAESLIHDHPAATWFQNRSDRVRTQFSEAIEQGKIAGEVRADVDSALLASEIIGTMDGLQILWLRDPARTDIVAIFDLYVDRLSAAIATGTA